MASWSLSGNAGTTPPTEFLGTLDKKPLVIKTDKVEVVRVEVDGRVGVGTPAPQVRLHVRGNRIRIESADGTRTLDLRADGSALDVQSAGAPLYVNNTGEPTYVNVSGGNVGVGTTQPRTPLHVLGRVATGADFTSAGAVTFFPPDGFAWFHIDNGPSGGRPIGRLRISYGGNPGDNEVVSILQNGQVSVNTTTPDPDARLTADGVSPDLGGSFTASGVVGRMTNPIGRGAGGQTAGVRGINDEGHGVQGQSQSHVGTEGTSNSGTAVYAESQSGVGVWGVTNGGPFAGFFQGPVRVTGPLQKAGGGFVIDHPLDPARRYLHHSFVESSEMKNLYDGIAELDSSGEAEVALPSWFAALNKEVRYQLTAIGAPAPDLHVAAELAQGRFRIAGGKPGMRVSWQVTAERDDPWARAHRLVVEEEKPSVEQGHYMHPELYEQPEDRDVMAARFPEMSRVKRTLRTTKESSAPAV